MFGFLHGIGIDTQGNSVCPERRWAKVTLRAHAATTSLSQGLVGDTSSQNLQLSQHVASNSAIQALLLDAPTNICPLIPFRLLAVNTEAH
jgi:hypothetical protein